MNRFDRVMAYVRGVQVEIPEPSSFEEQVNFDPNSGNELYRQVKLKKEILNKIIGLNEFRINLTTGEIIFDFTGKFLPSEYRNLINKENILNYLEHINYFKFVKLDAKNFLQNSRVRVLHSTIDIQVEEEPTNYFKFLNHLISKMETNFEAKRFSNGNINISKEAETNKQGITGYAKHKELMRRNKNNSLFRELLPPADLEYFKTVLRFEQKLSNAREIYQAFNITSKTNSLLNLLNSDIFPVVNTLNNLFDSLEVPNV